MRLADRFALRLHGTPGYCCVCGRWTMFRYWGRNLRETGVCARCSSSNRRRQLAIALLRALGGDHRRRLRALPELATLPPLAIFNCETEGGTHAVLSRLPGYVASEYFGPEHAPGAIVNGRRHEDLTRLSFPDRAFDVVLSSDVLEHVPDPYAAHREIHRVLRPGGRHLFTVPYIPAAARDEVRAVLRDGAVEHLLPPIHHGDPLRPEGILVFTHFGREMLERLRAIGFDARELRLRSAWRGVLGEDGYVFEARRLR
jgi:SAM-dependent methyltransferase